MVSDWWKRLFADLLQPEAGSAPMPAPSAPANEDLCKIADEAHFHYEYQAIHNQRVASGRIIHIWYQIAFASSPLIFGSILGLARDGSGKFADGLVMVGGALAGSAPLVFSLIYVFFFIDKSIRGYYPRLLALELMLGFQFWRQTLKALKGKEEAYVIACEDAAKGATSATDLWERVRAVPPAPFSPLNRGHSYPVVASVLLSLFYAVIIINLWPGNAGWQRIRNCLWN